MSKKVIKTQNKNSFKAHPITIFDNLKPLLLVLLLPLLKALINAVLRREINGLFLNEFLALAVLLTYSVLKWRVFSLKLTENTVQITKGLFLRRVAEIPISKISTVGMTTTLPDRAFGSATLRINTEAGKKGRTDYEIRLKRADALLVAEALSFESSAQTLKFSPVRVAIMSAAASSAFTGLIFTVPVIKTAGELLGTAIEEVLIDRINAVSLLNKVFPPIINTITIIFLLLYSVSFLVSFLRCVNFKATLGNGKIEISNGLLTKRRVSFKIKTVNCALIEQAPLMRMCRRYLVRVGIGGYGDNKGNKGVVVPSAKKYEVHKLFTALFPRVKVPDRMIRPSLYARYRFYLIPTVYTAVLIAAYLLMINLFPAFKDLINFGGVIAAVVLVYYFSLAEYNVKNSALAINDVIYAKYTHWAATREMFCEADRIGVINITRWPLDRRIGTCGIRFTVRSENAESIKVKHINYKEVMDRLSEFYHFE